MPDTPNQEQMEQIRDALRAGRKIEAIKQYRKATGKGLKEAKDIIDALDIDQRVQPGESPVPETLNQEQMEGIRDTLGAGRKIEAIKQYREATGKGLKECKDFIDALEGKLRQNEPERFEKSLKPKGVGCGAVLVFWLGLGAMSFIWLVAVFFV